MAGLDKRVQAALLAELAALDVDTISTLDEAQKQHFRYSCLLSDLGMRPRPRTMRSPREAYCRDLRRWQQAAAKRLVVV